MDGQTALYPLLLVFGDNIPFGITIFMQVIRHVFKVKPHCLILFQREIEEIPIIRLLQDTPALFQEFLIHRQEIAVGQTLGRIPKFRQRRREIQVNAILPRGCSGNARFLHPPFLPLPSG